MKKIFLRKKETNTQVNENIQMLLHEKQIVFQPNCQMEWMTTKMRITRATEKEGKRKKK